MEKSLKGGSGGAKQKKSLVGRTGSDHRERGYLG